MTTAIKQYNPSIVSAYNCIVDYNGKEWEIKIKTINTQPKFKLECDGLDKILLELIVMINNVDNNDSNILDFNTRLNYDNIGYFINMEVSEYVKRTRGKTSVK